MDHYLFSVLQKTPVSLALKELIDSGLQDYYVIEDESCILIGGFLASTPKSLNFSIEKDSSFEIDWKDQARLHCPYYKEGLIEVPLKDFGFPSDLTVKLYPGEGFGDLSHPTTQLMLHAMSRWIPKNAPVLDIGSGSGILSFAAHIGLSAKAQGLEIDPKALDLSKRNSSLNGAPIDFSPRISKEAFLDFSKGAILMNMITSEQAQVFKAYDFTLFKGTLIVSGLLHSETAKYLSMLCLTSDNVLGKTFLDGWACLVIRK